MRRLRDDQDGAVAVIVAILLVAIFGMAAYAIDVGALYQERRELQNGADAAALAIAEGCARGTISCVMGVVTGVAEDYSQANARDGATTVESIDLDVSGRTVTVYTLSEEASSGVTSLAHFFAPVFGANASQVRAQATAAWDRPPGTLRIFPLAFCLGTFNSVTANGTTFGGPPDHHMFYGNNKDENGDAIVVDCSLAAEAGTNDTYSGGFGWLDIKHPFYSLDAECHVTVQAGEWYPGSPGNSPSNEPLWNNCLNRIMQKVDQSDADAEADPLLVPIFDNHRDGGHGGDFRIVGFGALRPTGYRFFGAGSHPPAPDKPCIKNDNRCIRGWFTEFITLEEAVAGGAGGDFGVTTAGLTN